MTPATEGLETRPLGDRAAVSLLVVLIVVGVPLLVTLSKWMDEHRTTKIVNETDERLYLSGPTLRRLSLGFNGLVSDWYWMRSLQYVGHKIIDRPKHQQLDNLGELNLQLLAPLLDRATTLDPQFMQPYEYAAIVLPDIDLQEAIRITQKGIAANPNAWRLRQYLGYIYWQQGDFKTAAEIYGQAAQLPYAPYWLEAMRAQMLAQGGSRDTARKIYSQMYLESDEPTVREMARKKLLQIRWLEERDTIRQVLADFNAVHKRCPTSFREIEVELSKTKLRFDTSGAPVDPANFPYLLVQNGCDVGLDQRSEVPRK